MQVVNGTLIYLFSEQFPRWQFNLMVELEQFVLYCLLEPSSPLTNRETCAPGVPRRVPPGDARPVPRVVRSAPARGEREADRDSPRRATLLILQPSRLRRPPPRPPLRHLLAAHRFHYRGPKTTY